MRGPRATGNLPTLEKWEAQGHQIFVQRKDTINQSKSLCKIMQERREKIENIQQKIDNLAREIARKRNQVS